MRKTIPKIGDKIVGFGSMVQNHNQSRETIKFRSDVKEKKKKDRKKSKKKNEKKKKEKKKEKKKKHRKDKKKENNFDDIEHIDTTNKKEQNQSKNHALFQSIRKTKTLGKLSLPKNLFSPTEQDIKSTS